MQSNIKLNISLRYSRTDTLSTSHKREFRKESNIRQLKDKLSTNLKYKSRSNTYNPLFNTSNRNRSNMSNNHLFNTSNRNSHLFHTYNNHLLNMSNTNNHLFHTYNLQYSIKLRSNTLNHQYNRSNQKLNSLNQYNKYLKLLNTSNNLLYNIDLNRYNTHNLLNNQDYNTSHNPNNPGNNHLNLNNHSDTFHDSQELCKNNNHQDNQSDQSKPIPTIEDFLKVYSTEDIYNLSILFIK